MNKADVESSYSLWDDPTIKVCTKCKSPRRIRDYYKQTGTKTGYRHVCKPCQYKPKPKKCRSKEEGIYRHIYRQYLHSARHRELEFNLTEQDITKLVSRDCHHCGGAPTKYSPFDKRWFILKNGIDRLDNNKGYTMSNCVPCCATCNYSRQDLSVDEWIAHCTKVIVYYRKNNSA